MLAWKDGRRGGQAMRIGQSSHQGCVVLTLAGRLDLAAAPQVERAILKQLAEHPPAIICDLAQVEAIDPLCAGVFTAIRHPALGWPGTVLMLCAPPPLVADALLRLGVANRLAMYPSLVQALANARARPPGLREHLALGPVPTATAAGRRFVQEVCGRWGLQELAEPAALLASELVTNAVVHAGTAMELRVELLGPHLHVAVKDQNPDIPQVPAAKQGAHRGHGLRRVDQVATAWGVDEDGTGGKVVWCTLELPAPPSGAAGELTSGILIAHPYQMVAEGLGVMLDAQDDLAVLGVAHDSHQAIELAARHEPTVLLLDAHMPGPDLATTLRAVKASSPATKVLMLSADTRRATIAAALAAGADGFLAKDASSRQVAGAIRTLVDGAGSVVAAAEPAARPVRDPSVELRVRTLSGREREILGLLANGWSNRRIAEECFLSLNTVRTHVQNVLRKLDLRSKGQAIAFAFEQGLVLPERNSSEPQ
jgi:DNA-binding NarL/FixJ family response regulator/anti-anti-sigma regulatory factor